MVDSMAFFVPGKPIPQPRHRVAVRGRFPTAYIPKEHPVHAWKRHVESCAVAVLNEREIVRQWDRECALHLILAFYLPRPKSNKTQLPRCRPDLDNLDKAVMDALTGLLWSDDSQVVWLASEKVWSDPKDAGVKVTVWHD